MRVSFREVERSEEVRERQCKEMALCVIYLETQRDVGYDLQVEK